MESVIRGYHVYRSEQEPGNIHDPYAVAVVNDGVIVDKYFEQFVTSFFGRMERELELECRW